MGGAVEGGAGRTTKGTAANNFAYEARPLERERERETPFAGYFALTGWCSRWLSNSGGKNIMTPRFWLENVSPS
jgi:hypothetical protein